MPNKSFELSLNNGITPRRGSFEIFIQPSSLSTKQATDDDNKTMIWSGIKKGPPRKEKFPDPKSLVDDILKVIS